MKHDIDAGRNISRWVGVVVHNGTAK